MTPSRRDPDKPDRPAALVDLDDLPDVFIEPPVADPGAADAADAPTVGGTPVPTPTPAPDPTAPPLFITPGRSAAAAAIDESDAPTAAGVLLPRPTPDAPEPLPPLTSDERTRYSRHILVDEIGVEGQRRLKAASVLCIGAGGLGSPLLLYLVAAGIGRIGLVDPDVVDASNLHRQVLHGTGDLGKSKVSSADETLSDLNPHVTLTTHKTALTPDNALELIEPYDVVVDATDNFPVRYLINDACQILGKPWVYDSVHRFAGQVSVFHYKGGPTYRDLYPEPPLESDAPAARDAGVLGVLPAVIGSIQATEALKLVLGLGTSLSGRLLLYDALEMRFRELTLRKDPHAEPITTLGNYGPMLVSDDLEDDPTEIATHRITPRVLRDRLADGWHPFVLDVRDVAEGRVVSLPFTDRLHAAADLVAIADELPRDHDLLIYSRTGTRAAQACCTLVDLGFDPGRVYLLDGGLFRWSDEIDPSLPRY